MSAETEDNTFELVALIGSVVLFLYTVFSIFYVFIENRTERLILRALAWWIILLAEIAAVQMLYDRVINPLPDGEYRWGALPNTLTWLGIFYGGIYIIAMWTTYTDNKRLRDIEDL